MSYFSAFKQVLFVAIVVGLAATKDPRRFVRPQVLVVALLLVALGVFWQAIKVDYRVFLEQGSPARVFVSRSARESSTCHKRYRH